MCALAHPRLPTCYVFTDRHQSTACIVVSLDILWSDEGLILVNTPLGMSPIVCACFYSFFSASTGGLRRGGGAVAMAKVAMAKVAVSQLYKKRCEGGGGSAHGERHVSCFIHVHIRTHVCTRCRLSHVVKHFHGGISTYWHVPSSPPPAVELFRLVLVVQLPHLRPPLDFRLSAAQLARERRAARTADVGVRV